MTSLFMTSSNYDVTNGLVEVIWDFLKGTKGTKFYPSLKSFLQFHCCNNFSTFCIKTNQFLKFYRSLKPLSKYLHFHFTLFLLVGRATFILLCQGNCSMNKHRRQCNFRPGNDRILGAHRYPKWLRGALTLGPQKAIMWPDFTVPFQWGPVSSNF